MKKTYRYIGLAALLVLLASVCATLAPEQAGGAVQGGKSVESKYGKYLIFDAKPFEIPPEAAAKMKEAQKKEPSTVEATRLVSLDGTRLEGAPYADFVWLWKGSSKGYVEEEHVHDFDEYIGFIGTRGQQDPHGLGGEIEFWLSGEKYLLTKSCLIFVPKGLKHCPIRFNRIDSPIIFFTGSFGGKEAKYTRTPTQFSDAKAAERNYAKYISYGVNPKKAPPKDESPEAKKKQEEMRQKSGSTIEATRILDLDLVEGAPYIDFVWMYKGYEKNVTHPEHSHDWGEIFGYIGSVGQEDPHSLGGEVEFWVNGEKHVLTKSCLVWIPPRLPHCPVRFARIDKPILWFTIGIGMKSGQYTLMPTAEKQQ
jgi:quercetin dioxygenase-like cupin family protein